MKFTVYTVANILQFVRESHSFLRKIFALAWNRKGFDITSIQTSLKCHLDITLNIFKMLIALVCTMCFDPFTNIFSFNFCSSTSPLPSNTQPIKLLRRLLQKGYFKRCYKLKAPVKTLDPDGTRRSRLCLLSGVSCGQYFSLRWKLGSL